MQILKLEYITFLLNGLLFRYIISELDVMIQAFAITTDFD